VPTHEPALGGGRPSLKAVLADRLPMTPVAKRVLEEAGHHHRPRGRAERRWSLPAVLAALLRLPAPDPGAALLDALDIDRVRVAARLSEAIGGAQAGESG
jgi:hypothetical protein